MNCTEVVKARVSPEMKRQAKALAERELLTEAAWLKRLVIRELRAAKEEGSCDPVDGIRPPRGAAGGPSVDVKRVYVRLCPEDWLLLEARAAARGLRPANLPGRSNAVALAMAGAAAEGCEYLALRSSIAELSAIGRNINRPTAICGVSNLIPDSVAAEFRAMLKVCEALRDNTKALLKANLTSWASRYVG